MHYGRSQRIARTLLLSETNNDATGEVAEKRVRKPRVAKRAKVAAKKRTGKAAKRRKAA